VLVTYNRLNVTAASLASSIAAVGFTVMPFVDADQVGQEIIIPRNRLDDAAMKYDNLVIEIGGSEIPELYNDLVSLEVELDEELAGMFRMSITLFLNSDGSWNYLDDDRLTIWQQVVITLG